MPEPSQLRLLNKSWGYPMKFPWRGATPIFTFRHNANYLFFLALNFDQLSYFVFRYATQETQYR